MCWYPSVVHNPQAFSASLKNPQYLKDSLGSTMSQTKWFSWTDMFPETINSNSCYFNIELYIKVDRKYRIKTKKAITNFSHKSLRDTFW